MAQTESAGILEEFLDDEGEALARFFFLALPDPLDAEDLFLTLFVQPPEAKRAERPEAALARAVGRRIRAHRRGRQRSVYRPVEFDAGHEGTTGRAARQLAAWRRVPFAGRAAAALLLGGLTERDRVAEGLGIRPGDLWVRGERGLLAFHKELERRPRVAGAPKGWAAGELLARLLADGTFASFPLEGGAGRFRDELASALHAFRALHGSAVRSADWRRLRKRALREIPAPGAALLFDAFETPVGVFEAAVIDGVLVGTHFGTRGEEGWSAALGKGVDRARREPTALAQVRREILEYFDGRRRRFTVPYRLVNVSAFRAAVLDACARVPWGAVRSYKQLARDIGRPGSHRAVGGALGHNPIPVVIPCHRVIAHTGLLGGFSGGVDMKEKLLALEGMGALFAPPGRRSRETT